MSARVLIVQRRMTNYRVPLFIGMHRQLAAAGVRLQVVYGSATPAEELRDDAGFLPWGIRTRSTCFRLGSSYAVLQNIPMGLVGQQDLVVLPHENSLLFNYVLLMLRGVHRVRLAFWGHGANFQVLKRGLLRERFKAWISRQGHWWFAYTAVSAKRVAENGFPLERITCLNNSIHMQELSQWRDSILDSEIVELRLKLGLVGEKVGVFIGSLHRDKRIEFLLQSADLLRERIPEFELIVIGDGPLRSLLQRFAATRTWCKWVGAQHGREKVLYLAQGHVLLNPGMVGLGILDGFSMGLPLVTADCGIHSPEIAYLENEANGLMTADNVPAFVDGASSVL
jgi:glycosyltransferase involved in cell wall biosynthesis